jgi:hypothetical protein
MPGITLRYMQNGWKMWTRTPLLSLSPRKEVAFVRNILARIWWRRIENELYCSQMLSQQYFSILRCVSLLVITRSYLGSYYRKESAASPPRDERQQRICWIRDIWSCFARTRCQAGLFWCIEINYCARFRKKLHS